jgi:hypothetical protein
MIRLILPVALLSHFIYSCFMVKQGLITSGHDSKELEFLAHKRDRLWRE